MRSIALLAVGVACVVGTSADAKNSSCGSWFAVDYVSCNDRPVAILHEEMDELYAKALAKRAVGQESLVREQKSWLVGRGSNCSIPIFWWMTRQDVRRARPCLVAAYETRVVSLAALVTPEVPESLARLPSAGPPADDRGLQAYDRARTFYGQRRWTRALIEFERATEQRVGFYEAYVGRGKTYLLIGNNFGAVRDFETAMQLANGDLGRKKDVTALRNSAELGIRKRFWEEQAFSCRVGTFVYPSKNDNVYDPKRRYNPSIPRSDWEKDYVSEGSKDCDDGDMAFFSGLLCAAGDERGCRGVAIAQDDDGRWWRSKRRIGETDTADHASFSTEQGLGVQNYLASTANKKAFERWLEWIDRNPRIYAPLPSYCTHKECVFKLIDCPLLVTIAARFDLAVRATSVCNPLRYLNIPTPEEIHDQLRQAVDRLADEASRFEKSLNDLIAKLGQAFGIPGLDKLLPTPIEDLRKHTREVAQNFKEAREKLLGPQLGEAAARLAQSIALANAVVNGVDIDASVKVDTGKLVFKSGGVNIEGTSVNITGSVAYNPNGEHIAAVEVFLLRNLGYQSDELNKAAAIIYERDKDNPFFEYLAHGRTERMLELILKKCPSLERPSVSRFQWFPERGEELQGDRNKTAWAESMYWDCIFLSRLYEHDVRSALASSGAAPDPFANLGDALKEVHRLLSQLKGLTDKIDGRLKEIDQKLKSSVPIVGDYCDHNWCPPVVPHVGPGPSLPLPGLH